MSIKTLVKATGESLSKHSPQILTGIGVAGLVSTAVLAVRATPKALLILEREQVRLAEIGNGTLEILDSEEETKPEDWDLKPQEVIKLTWKCYIPAMVTGAISIICIIGATTIQNRRAAALASVYSLSELALKEYQEKVKETIGENKELKIRDDIMKDRVEKDPIAGKEVLMTKHGDFLCYDTQSGRYFRSNMERVRRSVNDLNEQLINEMYVSLNDFYSHLDLPGIKLGDDMGWSLESGQLDVHFSGQLTEEGEPCMALDYRVAPHFWGK